MLPVKTKGKEKRKTLPTISVVSFLLSAGILLYLPLVAVMSAKGDAQLDPLVLITFAINGTIGLFFLFRSALKRAVSLSLMHWAFYVLMFVYAPFSQYMNGYDSWHYALSIDDYLQINCLIFLWGLVFGAITVGRFRTKETGEKSLCFNRDFYLSLPEVDARVASIVTFASFLATVVLVVVVGFENLFSRSTYITGLSQSMGLVFDKMIRTLPVFCFAIQIVRFKQTDKIDLFFLVCGILLLIADFPTGIARYSLACLYGGLALLLIESLSRDKGFFLLLFLVAFLLVFPSINVFRRSTFDIGTFAISLLNSIQQLPQGFCSDDYDAYSMLGRTCHYIMVFGPTNGTQLLAVILFFIPRSIWASKAYGSGNLVATSQGQEYTNLSCPLPSEGLINFGVIGLLLFAVAVALVCRLADGKTVTSNSPITLFYPFGCMMLFFIMRGDLLSSYAYLVGFFVAFFTVSFLAFKRVIVLKREEKIE